MTRVKPRPVFNEERTKRRIRLSTALILIQNSKILPFKLSSGFKCFYCECTFGDMELLQEHTNINHASPDGMMIRTAFSAIKKKYQLVNVNIVDLGCRLCDDPIQSFEDLKIHLSENHKKLLDPNNDGVVPFRIANRVSQCVVCGKRYTGFLALSKHMNEHYPNYICEDCGTGFLTLDRLKHHKLVHSIDSHPCKECGKEFKSELARNNHHKLVHLKQAIQQSKCPHCLETFRGYYGRQKHILTVHGVTVEQYQCEICSKKFFLKNLLNCHVKRVHMKGPKKDAPTEVQTCQTCSKTFSSTLALSLHVRRTHLMERHHKCSECDMKFFRTNQLQEHMVKHTGVRSFQCAVCLKSYGRKKTLIEHMRIHKNDRRFKCEHCGQAFVAKCTWKGHMRAKHGELV